MTDPRLEKLADILVNYCIAVRTGDWVRVQADVLAKWAANAPLAFVDQYIGNLRQYRAIAIDVGDQDSLKVDAEKLHNVLDSYGIANRFEIYSGTHVSNVAFRFQDELLPFFGQILAPAAKR